MTDNVFHELIEARRLVAQKEEEALHYMARKIDSIEEHNNELKRLIKEVDQFLAKPEDK